ncbi:MAG: alpha/beta hydrolase-fold protein, partial [Bacteroidota bacterium]
EQTFIAGSSMGGLISMYAICEYPEVFSRAACLSTHWIGTFDTLNNPIPDAFANYLTDNLPSPENHKIYFDFGTETLDAFYEPYQIIADSIMVSRGYDEQNWTTQKFEGENHSERAWHKRLHIPVSFLAGVD